MNYKNSLQQSILNIVKTTENQKAITELRRKFIDIHNSLVNNTSFILKNYSQILLNGKNTIIYLPDLTCYIAQSSEISAEQIKRAYMSVNPYKSRGRKIYSEALDNY